MADTDPIREGFPECVHLREHTSENRAGIAFHRSWIPAFGSRPEDRARRYAPEASLTAALARVAALEEALRECAAIIPGMAASKMVTADAAIAAVRRARALLAPSAEEAGDG